MISPSSAASLLNLGPSQSLWVHLTDKPRQAKEKESETQAIEPDNIKDNSKVNTETEKIKSESETEIRK